MRRIDDGAEIGAQIERIADRERARALDHLFREAVANGALNQQPRRRFADLALIAEHEADRNIRRHGQIRRVGEDDVGALAAQLEADALQIRIGRRGHDFAADLARAGEGDAVDIVMRGERCAGLVVAGHHLQNAFRQAGFERELGDAQTNQRRVLGRLEHHRISGDEGRAEFPGADHRRRIPGQNRADHAERRARDHRGDVVVEMRKLVVELVGRLAVPPQTVDREVDLELFGEPDRHAHVAAFERGEPQGFGGDAIGPIEQDALALFRAHALPAARFERAPRAGDRAVDVGRLAIRYGGNRLAVDRRDHVECLAGQRACQLAVDDGLHGRDRQFFRVGDLPLLAFQHGVCSGLMCVLSDFRSAGSA